MTTRARLVLLAAAWVAALAIGYRAVADDNRPILAFGVNLAESGG